MFDLDQSVSSWRAEMAAGGACAGADLDELESHLRDSVACLSTAGLSADESFLIAVRRLGRPDDLRPEYGKVHPERVWRDRLIWMLTGVVAWSTITACTSFLSGAGLTLAALLGLRGETYSVATIATDVLGLAIAAIAATVAYRWARLGRIGRRPMAWVIAVPIVMLLGRMLWYLSMMLTARSLTADDLGRSVWARSYWNFAAGILIPALFALLAIRLQKRARQTAETAA